MNDILGLDGQRSADTWLRIDDDAPLPDQGPVIISLERWKQQADQLQGLTHRLGLALINTDDVLELPEEALQVALFALNFPAFTDGRAYSQARQLRERLGYQGVIRACGDVLHDQLFYMARCGFDQFELPSNLDEPSLQQALGTFSTAYQPTRSGPSVSSAGIIKAAG